MSAIYGLLGVDDSERVFLSTLGQDVIYDAIGELVNRYNADLMRMMSVFVEESTTNHKERYKLPGGGRLQKMSGEAPSAEVRAFGGWDVAYPLEQFGASLGGSRIRFAYMTVRDLDRHLQTVFIQDMNTVRYEILRRLFNNTQRSFEDEHWGTLLVEALANGDSVVYPPVVGSEDEAVENHYFHTGYTVANISDTNNPLSTVATELEEHFGKPQGGSRIVAFIPDQSALITNLEALTGWVDVDDIAITPGDDTARVTALPPNVPGRTIGRHSGAGVWVNVWDWIPDNYILGTHLGAPRPLKVRYDPADTGLPRGLALVADSEKYPIQESHWEHRFGFGVGNRLNGVFLEFDASTWDIPAGYEY